MSDQESRIARNVALRYLRARRKSSYPEFLKFLGEVFSKLHGKDSYSASELRTQAQKHPDFGTYEKDYQAYLEKAWHDPASKLVRDGYKYVWKS